MTMHVSLSIVFVIQKRGYIHIFHAYIILLSMLTLISKDYAMKKKHLGHRLSNKRQLATARPVVIDHLLPRAHLNLLLVGTEKNL